MATEAQRKAVARYDAENTVQLKLKLNRGTDADIIEHLEGQENKSGYIKQLIRDDISQGTQWGSFTEWLIRQDQISYAADMMDTFDYAVKDIEYYGEHPEDSDANIVPELRETMKNSEYEIKELYSMYQRDGGTRSYQDALESLRRYITELQNIEIE